jgi:hypothetical protein
VLHLRASIVLLVCSGAMCYIDVTWNCDESGHGRVRLSMSRCSFVIAFQNLVGVYDSMARRCLSRFYALCLDFKTCLKLANHCALFKHQAF